MHKTETKKDVDKYECCIKQDALKTLRIENNWISSAHGEVYNELLNLWV